MVTLYSNIRHEMKTGDLLIWKTRSVANIFDFLLFLYQKIFGAKYTHVGIVVKMGNRLMMVDAAPPVVKVFPISLCRDFYLVKTNIEDKDSHIDVLFNRLGNKYSLLDMVRGVFKFKRNAKEDYCSDLASEFYNQIGYIDDEDAGQTPDSLVEAIVKASGNEPILVKIDRGNLNVL